ncbi:hypothetical protein E0Z10_g2723 [Xylaria hypoxylon]|uniref:DM2 domain-containing protein n=1 Tax=Xylaria hypoxylon TaxID=37992 RepID=A0A4Z0YP26_9PEZI|nr:hypothetical protein E0Z10_g2723 [Xylaria hypoxylon]
MMSSGPHHQVPLTSAQVAQQQQQAAMQFEMAKRRSRKPTDKNLPDGIDDSIVGDVAQRYRELGDFERRLDATMTRKRLDIVDAVTRSAKRWKTLRIWITNTAEDQIWQGNGINVDTFDFSSNLEPTYRVKIEARLLDDDDDLDNDDEPEDTKSGTDDPDRMEEDGPVDTKSRTTKPPRYRFSHFFKALYVDFPTNRGGTEQSVEWKKPERVGGGTNLPAAADFDELTFKRNGDENLNITINIIRHEEPERYALSPELEDIVDMREATRQEIVMGVWEYIKMMGLQEDEEKRHFAVTSFCEALSLSYTIRLDEQFHKDPQPTVYDVRVAVDDPLREKMTAFLNNAGYAGMLKEVASLDEQLAIIVQAIHVSKAKHDFLNSLSEDPATFVRNWLSSQKRDLEVILGEAMRGGGEDVNGDEWRKGGKESIWGTINARESVNSLLSRTPSQPQQSQNTAVITGGASGIGLALTKKCAGYGMRVLVADWDEKNLDAAKSALGDNVSTIKVDVSKTEDWVTLKEKVLKDFGGKINLLALNAGVSAPTSFEDADASGFQKILNTNLFGVLNGITTLLPLVKEHASPSSPASIVITGSKQGITNPPGNPAYNASKAAVKTLAEHLSFDLAASHPSVSVHLLVPGWTWTQLAGAASGREKPAAAWTAEQVVDYLEAKMAEGQFWVLCPDNDVTEDTDKRRVQWNTNDVLLGRPPLSRWREEYKDEFKEWMEKK